ncbi:hypothetical protein [Tsukamurella pulmonis]|uniref:hypothetical protein n=1 Tax=Tsukamurella pulmonis TaxID=47312 RepID=UPI000B273B53|nr:hypothetical protein [Tsukamurella pulmonis]
MDWESPTAADLAKAQEKRNAYSSTHEPESTSYSPADMARMLDEARIREAVVRESERYR